MAVRIPEDEKRAACPQDFTWPLFSFYRLRENQRKLTYIHWSYARALFLKERDLFLAVVTLKIPTPWRSAEFKLANWTFSNRKASKGRFCRPHIRRGPSWFVKHLKTPLICLRFSFNPWILESIYSTCLGTITKFTVTRCLCCSLASIKA